LYVLIFKLPERRQKNKDSNEKTALFATQIVNSNTKKCSSFKHLQYNKQATGTIKVPQTILRLKVEFV
jgi:hypothetical protein